MRHVLCVLVVLLPVHLKAQGQREIEITAQQILARVDEVLQYPKGLLKGALMHIYPDGRSFRIAIKASITDEDFLFEFSNQKRGRQLQVLYNLGGEDIWVYNLLAIQLYNKKGIDRFDPVLSTNYNYLDLSNADLQSNYTAEIETKSTVIKGRAAYVLKLVPICNEEKCRKSQNYGLLTLYVDKEHYIPLRIDFHDNNKILLKTMSIARVAYFQQRAFPVRYDMLHVRKGTLTILSFFNVEESVTFDKKIFRHQNLGNEE
jgi:outer membrane lipoprotein-sorting protein